MGPTEFQVERRFGVRSWPSSETTGRSFDRCEAAGRVDRALSETRRETTVSDGEPTYPAGLESGEPPERIELPTC
jgi:hypothetical protein